ncbi:hypothetical protein LZ30DRAFT_181227 [Colletotrichum cereale]|nr:hypothetical protein LZ30DRAFT_181227 [Colletotrichum cereale]
MSLHISPNTKTSVLAETYLMRRIGAEVVQGVVGEPHPLKYAARSHVAPRAVHVVAVLPRLSPSTKLSSNHSLRPVSSASRVGFDIQMAPVEWVEQRAVNYSTLEDGKERKITAPGSRSNREDKRSSAAYLTVPISTEPMASQHRRSWIRRYWIFVLAMAILVVGGIIAGAVGGINASQQPNAQGSS